MVGAPSVTKALKRKIQASAEKASMKNLYSYQFYQDIQPIIPMEYMLTSPSTEYLMIPEMCRYSSYGYEASLPQQSLYWAPPTRSDLVKMELRNSLQTRQMTTFNQPTFTPAFYQTQPQYSGFVEAREMMRTLPNPDPKQQMHYGGVEIGVDESKVINSQMHVSSSTQSLFDDVFDDIPIGREDKDGAETPEQLHCSFDWNLGAGEFEFDCANPETRLFVNTVLSIS
ncbi:unnamed protein product, partial [Mesorhabditis belari]|uniref:Uncharacterized protein n=1 Tax=Mesorhabditis belari TaxID=2138241 RepID=A0AAF3FKD2_9BILA